MGFTMTASGSAQAGRKERPSSRPVARRRLLQAAVVLLLLALLVALFYAEENWRGRRDWERYRANLAARKIDFNWHRLAPPSVPDRDNFAATPFLAALFDFAPGTHTPRDLAAYNRTAGFAQNGEPYLEIRHPEQALLTVVPGEKTDLLPALRFLSRPTGRSATSTAPQSLPLERSAQAAALLAALRQYRPVLDELRLAGRRPSARFDLDYNADTPWNVSQPHLPLLKRVGMVLGLRALAELNLQDPQAAADDLDLLISVANSLSAEPFESSYWTRLEILDVGRQVLWEGLADHRWSDGQLSRFQARLAAIDLLGAASKPLFLARAHGEFLFSAIHKRPVIVAQWRFGPGLGNALLPLVLHRMPTGWMYLEHLAFQCRIDDSILRGFDPQARRVRPKAIDQAGDNHWPLLRHRLLSGRLLDSQVELARAAALAQTRLDQAMIACALERHRLAHGALPPTLDALVPQYLDSLPSDLITTAPLKYRRATDGSFLLYSLGWNEQDDGGKAVLAPGSKRLDPAQGDWVWPK